MASMRVAELGPHRTRFQTDAGKDQSRTVQWVGCNDYNGKARDPDGGWLATQSRAVDHSRRCRCTGVALIVLLQAVRVLA